MSEKLRIKELYGPEYDLHKLLRHCFMLMKKFLEYEADRGKASCSDFERSPIHTRLVILCYIVLKYAENCEKITAEEFVSFLSESQDIIIPADVVFFTMIGQTIVSRILEDKDIVYMVLEQLSEDNQKHCYSDCMDSVVNLVNECKWSMEQRIKQLQDTKTDGWKTILDTGKMFVSFLDYLTGIKPRTSKDVISLSRDFLEALREQVSADTILLFTIFGVAYQIVYIAQR